MNSIERNAGIQLDTMTREYAAKHRCDYRTAAYAVLSANSDLRRRYNDRHGDTVKKYHGDTLPPARRAMAGLLADPGKVRFLAGSLIDHLAHQHIDRDRTGAANPGEAYKRAVRAVQEEHPSLAVAAETGFISETDFALLAMLVPSVGGEVARGNFSNRCSCGQSKEYCRGKKLARRRGVDEDDVKEFSACILAARAHGSELDAISCYF